VTCVVVSSLELFPKKAASIRRTKIAKAIIITEFTGSSIPFNPFGPIILTRR
jgi:hypothetical protein